MITLGVFWVSCAYEADVGEMYWFSIIFDAILINILHSIYSEKKTNSEKMKLKEDE